MDCERAWRELRLRLAGSAFRMRFRLTPEEQTYCRRKGWKLLSGQTERMIRERLAPAQPAHDGKQTPMRGHPVFKAQHATGCCCRGCLAKWHGLPPGRELDEAEIAYVTAILIYWLREQVGPATPGDDGRGEQPDLFE